MSPAGHDGPQPVKPGLTRLGRHTTVEDLDRVPTSVLHRAYLERRRNSGSRDVRATTRSTTGNYVEDPAFLDMLARMIRRAGRRVGDGDPELIGRLDQMLREERERAVGAAFWGLLRRGRTSSEIAPHLGVSPQGAFQRFARWRPADMPPRWDRLGNGSSDEGGSGGDGQA